LRDLNDSNLPIFGGNIISTLKSEPFMAALSLLFYLLKKRSQQTWLLFVFSRSD